MSSVVATAYAVNVFMVDAGVYDLSRACSATTLPAASAMAMAYSSPKSEAAVSNWLISAFAAAASTVFEASSPPTIVAAGTALPGFLAVMCSTSCRVRTPGSLSKMSATT